MAHAELIDDAKLPALQKTNRYISGLIRLGRIKKHFDLEKAALYTIIREPYAHLNSHLNWLIATYNDSDDAYFKYNNPVIFNIGRDLSRYNFDSMKNLQHFVDDISDLHAPFFDNMQTRYFLDSEVTRVSHEHLKEAKDNAKMFTLVGLTENYTDFIHNFIKINRFKKPVLNKKLNLSRSSPLFDYRDNAVREILNPLVCFDLELYAHLRKMNQK